MQQYVVKIVKIIDCQGIPVFHLSQFCTEFFFSTEDFLNNLIDGNFLLRGGENKMPPTQKTSVRRGH
jgi:hypothetical protein